MGKKAFSLQKGTYKVISGGEIGLFSSFSPPLPQLYPQKYGKGGRTALPKILLTRCIHDKCGPKTQGREYNRACTYGALTYSRHRLP